MTRSTRQTTWCVGTRQRPLRVTGNRATALPQYGGFTLVELLVVIGIIAVLAALIVPAVFQARVTARNAAIKAEIDMLHMAIMNYKNEFGSFPPADSDTHPDGDAKLRNHIKRQFPRADLTPYVFDTGWTEQKGKKDQFYVGFSRDNIDNDNDGSTDEKDGSEADYIAIEPISALEFYLKGYTSSPIQPIKPSKRTALFDFDGTRINPATGGYYPTGKPGSPYIYIDADNYGTTFGAYTAETNPVTGDYYNPDTFQILCAGQDEIWGPTSVDDLSNFWKGTRGDQ